MRRPILVVIVAAAVAVATGGVAVVVRQAHLQREVRELRDLVQSGNDRLDEVLQAQRASLSALGHMNLQVAQLQAKAPNAPGQSAATNEPAPAQKEARPPEPPSPEVYENVQKGNALIDSAIATGRWTERDRDRLQALLRSLPNEEATPLMNKVITALNARQLDFPIPGLPF